MQMRIRLWKDRKFFNRGSLTCARCNSQNHFQLFEGDLCARCHKNRPASQAREATRQAQSEAAKAHLANKPAARKRTEPWPQSDRTLQLRLQVDQLCAEHAVSRRELARQLNLNESRFDGWYYGSYGPEGQRRMNLRVAKSIKEIIQPLEEAVA